MLRSCTVEPRTKEGVMADRILPTETHVPAEPTHQHTNTHSYNAPGLSPLEFLRAVMDDPHLPMSYRMEAAKALLPYTNSFPRSVAPPQCTYVIPPLSYGPWSEVCERWPREEGS